MMDNMLKNTYWFIGMGAAVWFCGWIQSAGLMTVANRVSNRMRIEFFRAILRQDIGYFDVHSSAEDRFRGHFELMELFPVHFRSSENLSLRVDENVYS